MTATSSTISSTPKPSWPLSLHSEVGTIEQQTRKCLTDYAGSTPSVMCVLLDMDKVKDIMRASAIESFQSRAAFYRRQKGFCLDWLYEAAAETIASTLGLAPWNLANSTSFHKAIPDIHEALNAELKGIIDKSSTPVSDGVPADDIAPKKKVGRPSSIPFAAKKLALEAKHEGATGKRIAELVYRTARPSPRQVKDAPNILKHFERSKNS